VYFDYALQPLTLQPPIFGGQQYERITSHTKATNYRSLYTESSLSLDASLSSSRLRVVFGLRAS